MRPWKVRRPTLGLSLSDCALDSWKDTSFEECPAVEDGFAAAIARRPPRRRVRPVILKAKKVFTVVVPCRVLQKQLLLVLS